MGIINDMILIDKRRDAANLLSACNDMAIQHTSLKLEIQDLKVKMKADIIADKWIKQDFIKAGQLLQALDNISGKKVSYKAALITLKDVIFNEGYEIEVQAAIDIL